MKRKIYSTEVIIKAAELAELPVSAVMSLMIKLEEAFNIITPSRLNHPISNIEDLLQEVCFLSHVSPEDVKTKTRKREVSYARHVFVKIAQEAFPKIKPKDISYLIDKEYQVINWYIKEVDKVPEKRRAYEIIRGYLNL